MDPNNRLTKKGERMLTPIWKISALFGLIVLVMLVAVPIASAHHPVVVASLTCDGTVTFTVTAEECVPYQFASPP